MVLIDILFTIYQESDIIKILLKHDAILYGPYIRNLVCKNFIDDNDTVVMAIIPSCYKKIIERSLCKFIYDKISINNFNNIKEKITYILKRKINNKENLIKVLDILYVSDLILEDGILKNGLTDYLLLDINSIAITRNGITIIPSEDNKQHIEVCNPFMDIIKKIDKKQFTVVSNIKNLSQIKLIYSYLDDEWKNKDNRIQLKKNKNQKEFCAICREYLKETDCVFKLPCSHYYHKQCWREHMLSCLQTYFSAGAATTSIFDKKTNNMKIIKCPECRKEYPFLQVLR